MKKKKRRWNSIAYRMVIVLSLIILPFNIVSLVTVAFTMKDARKQAAVSIENITELTIQQIDSRLSAMNDFFYNLGENQPDFMLYKTQAERDVKIIMAESNLAIYFNTIVSNDAFADVLYWQSEKYDKFYIGMDSLTNEQCRKNSTAKAILREFLETDRKKSYAHWSIAEIEGMKWLLKTYMEDDFYYGSLISLDEIEYRLKESAAFPEIKISFVSKKEELPQKNDGICIAKASKNGNFWMQVQIPNSQVYSRLSAVQKLCMGFAVLYILLIPFLIWLIHRMVLRPLKRVNQAMDRLKNGDQDYRITVKKDSEEFISINETFNNMADRIQELKIANYEKELEKQRIELRNLQLQIRPHFLMNMFNLLFSFAQIESYQNIQKLSVYLSEYFRYIFQSSKELQPFSMELNLIQKYLEIAAVRYPDCVEVVYEIDEEAFAVEVPPLLIHNFVENIFKHIVNYDKKIHLRLEAFTDEKEATFMIADDGPGLPEGMAEEINQGIFRTEKSGKIHVGIENSWKRLQYFYHGKGSLTVESEPGEGTCFTILIPVKEKNNEFTDCR